MCICFAIGSAKDRNSLLVNFMGGGGEHAPAVTKSRPTIVLPQRPSSDSFFANGFSGLGFSPGPMTLVSGYFSDQGPFSFSQLLAGAMVSPIAAKPAFVMSNGSGKEENVGDSAEGEIGESDVGYKRNRPGNLAVALPHLMPESLSPLLMVPPGLSPSGLLNTPGFLSPIQSPFGMSHQQALAHVTAQAVFSQSYMQMQAEFQQQFSPAEPLPEQSSTAPAQSETLLANPPAVELESSRIESSDVSQSENKVGHVSGGKPGGDGYNWRKYGQKHVKASECPRSYYKCTHPNCPVKKKVEQSVDGSISTIVYKGHHNHDPPQHNKRRKDSFVLDKAVNSQSKPAFVSQDWTGMDQANEASRFDSESVNFLETTQQALERCPRPSYRDEADEGVIVLGDDDGDEPNAKRRTMDAAQSMKPSTHHTITESKIVVQTRSEVDLLDDGYKWRKYGQKVVKGNPHPRSYYRCTYAGCNVRKHVERSSADPKAVITTYEGKHNHETPAERFSSHSTGGAVKSQRLGDEHPTEIGLGNQHQQEMIPITLQLKEELTA